MANGGSIERNGYQMGGMPMPLAPNPMGPQQSQPMNNQPGNPMNSFGQQTQNGINGDPVRDVGYTAPPPFATLDNNLPPPQPVQSPVPSSYNPLMSNTPPAPMADGGAVENALRVAKLRLAEGGKAELKFEQAPSHLNFQYARPGSYRTELGIEEPVFRQWVEKNKVPFDPNEERPDYDMRGYYKAMVTGSPEYRSTEIDPYDHRPHYPDTFKTPSHESFSADSKYATSDAPKWNEDDQLIDRTGAIAYDSTLPHKAEGGSLEDNTSVAQQDDASREQFLHKELEGSAPQYNPSYDKAIKAAYQYTPPGAAMDAAGMLGNPSIKENLQSGRYIPAAMQAAAVAMPLGMAGRRAATSGLKAGAEQLYKLGKPDVVGMPGYTAYKTVEDWAPTVVGQQAWNAAKDYGGQAAEAARHALGFARGGTTPKVQGDQQAQTPLSTSGSATTPNKEHQISPEEYKKGNTQKYEYVMAQGGSINTETKEALKIANRAHFRHGGVKQVNPNMDYSNSMRTYYDLVNAGHSPETAAGMVGNFMVESPNKQGNQLSFGETERGVKPGTGGAGLAQWTGPRRQEFQNFAKKEGMDWHTPQANTAFFSHEAKTNPWIGKQLEKVEAQPSAGAAAETAAKQYFRPRADALRETLGARVGYAQNVADIAGRGNPFGGQALADQSQRATMFAQQQPEAQVTPANLPKAEDQIAPAKATPTASAAPTTTGVDNSASNQPPMNFAPPQQPAPVAAPNEESTQNFLKSQMNAPEPQEQAQPAQAEAPKMEAPEPVVQQEQPDIPDTQVQALETSEDNTPFTFDFDQAANGGAIKPKYHSDESKISKELLDHALKLASGGRTPAWQRAAGKNKNGGLNAKGRASAKAEGHNLKPPQPEGGARRDSFCSRMKGMKAKLTSKETANDPDSRINKSLRAWNCHADGGAVENALRIAKKTKSPVRLHHTLARHGYATDGGVEEDVQVALPKDTASFEQPKEEAQQQFLKKNLEGSAPQYDPEGGKETAKEAGQFVAGLTTPGAIADAAGYLGGPSIRENIHEGNYGTAALQAAGAVPLLGPLAKGALGAGLLYKAAKGLSKAEMSPNIVRSMMGELGQGDKAVEDALRIAKETKPTITSALEAKHPNVDFVLGEKESGPLTLNRVVVPEEHRGKGLGTSFMNDLLAKADESGRIVSLSPSSDFGGNKNKLNEWYKSLGFVPNKGRNKDFSFRETMYRPPKVEDNSVENAVRLARGLPMDEPTRMGRATDQGYSGPWYHGSQRTDRLTEGKSINPKRATSGPMPFFTDDPNIASNYAMGKQDTSRMAADEGNVANYFTVHPKELGWSGRTEMPVEQTWHFLPQETKQKILENYGRIGYADRDQAVGDLIVHPEFGGLSSPDHYSYILKNEAKGNPLTALRNIWYEGGDLVNNPEQLADIYKLAGYPHQISQKNAPWTEAKGVMPAMLRMENPLTTHNAEEINEKVIPYLEQAFAKDKTRKTTGSNSDMWDKNYRYTPKEWVAQLKEDMAKGDNSYAWTSIPDKVTEQLKALGYDGIIDTGGKGGGQGHRVAIPFHSHQVRSKFAKFDQKHVGKADLLKSNGGEVENALRLTKSNRKG
jgi:GNAT superfamily N-acetyltransferase